MNVARYCAPAVLGLSVSGFALPFLVVEDTALPWPTPFEQLSNESWNLFEAWGDISGVPDSVLLGPQERSIAAWGLRTFELPPLPEDKGELQALGDRLDQLIAFATQQRRYDSMAYEDTKTLTKSIEDWSLRQHLLDELDEAKRKASDLQARLEDSTRLLAAMMRAESETSPSQPQHPVQIVIMAPRKEGMIEKVASDSATKVVSSAILTLAGVLWAWVKIRASRKAKRTQWTSGRTFRRGSR